VPSQPAAPVVTGAYNSVSLTWTAPNNGGVAITNYDIFWDPDGNLSDEFVYLATTANLFYTVSTGITQGTIYKFKILARNTIGVSSQSSAGQALAASVPAQPNAPTKATASKTLITINWTEPNNRGSTITGYRVYWDNGVGGLPRDLLTTVSNTVFTASTTVLTPDLIDGQSY